MIRCTLKPPHSRARTTSSADNAAAAGASSEACHAHLVNQRHQCGITFGNRLAVLAQALDVTADRVGGHRARLFKTCAIGDETRQRRTGSPCTRPRAPVAAAPCRCTPRPTRSPCASWTHPITPRPLRQPLQLSLPAPSSMRGIAEAKLMVDQAVAILT